MLRCWSLGRRVDTRSVLVAADNHLQDRPHKQPRRWLRQRDSRCRLDTASKQSFHSQVGTARADRRHKQNSQWPLKPDWPSRADKDCRSPFRFGLERSQERSRNSWCNLRRRNRCLWDRKYKRLGLLGSGRFQERREDKRRMRSCPCFHSSSQGSTECTRSFLLCLRTTL